MWEKARSFCRHCHPQQVGNLQGQIPCECQRPAARDLLNWSSPPCPLATNLVQAFVNSHLDYRSGLPSGLTASKPLSTLVMESPLQKADVIPPRIPSDATSRAGCSLSTFLLASELPQPGNVSTGPSVF